MTYRWRCLEGNVRCRCTCHRGESVQQEAARKPQTWQTSCNWNFIRSLVCWERIGRRSRGYTRLCRQTSTRHIKFFRGLQSVIKTYQAISFSLDIQVQTALEISPLAWHTQCDFNTNMPFPQTSILSSRNVSHKTNVMKRKLGMLFPSPQSFTNEIQKEARKKPTF